MTPRRVMLVLPDLGLGGAQVVAARLAALLRDRGDDVVIATLGPTETDHVAVPRGVSRFVVRPTTGAPGLLGVLRKNVLRSRCLRRQLREWPSDVIIAFVDSTNLFTLLATWAMGIPVIVSERVDPRMHRIPRVQRLLRRLIYWRAAAVVTQTERIAEWARRVVPRHRVHVIPNPVPIPAARTDPHMPPIALAIGRLVPQKGFDLLIEAVALVGPDVLDSWQVEILGEGPCREELQQLLVSRGLSDRVHLVGQVRDVVERLSRASLFVLSSRFEGFPNALTEAMAAGVASISFDCPTGPRELITPGVDGVLVPPGDVVALSKALTELMTSPDKRRRIGEAARVSMSKYAPNHVGDQWDGLIDEVVSRVRHRRRR